MASADKQHGASLIGLMVVATVMGILAVAGSRLFSDMARSLRLIGLKNERDNLIRHYGTMIESGWTATNEERCGSGNFCGGKAGSGVVIPSGGLYLANNHYDYGNTSGSGKWWKVRAVYVEDPDRWDKETTRVIRLRVEFLPQQHPIIKTHIAPAEELVVIAICRECPFIQRVAP